MIIARLAGGLGNQMFQYAAAKRLAEFRKVELKIDPSALDSSCDCTVRPFQLKHLCITASIATPEEIAYVSGYSQSGVAGKISRFISRGGGGGRSRVYSERTFGFDPTVLSLPDNTILEGYWQSEKYFEDIGHIIRKEFVPKTLLKEKDLELTEIIQAENSVSLHVRSGDYISDAKVNAVHGVCSTDYYLKSLEVMEAAVASPHVFIFSDEIPWVTKKLRFPCPATFIQHNAAPHDAHLDLYLMSLCRHHIIANSTFSWWGAWLSQNPEKKVIAPQKWFLNPSLETGDLLPSGWMKL